MTPFTSTTGAVSRIPEDGTAKDFFDLFVSDEVFEAFVEETNRYARQYIAHKPDQRWRETNVEEMKAYFGLNILFGIKKLPDTDLYWSKDPALGVPYVQKDTKLVHFLSTQSNPVGVHTVNRKQKDGTIIQIPTVPVVVDYNKNMGGVDLSDQQRQYYAVGRKSRKWWRYLLWFFIDVSIVNAHFLECQADNHRSKTQLKFRLELLKMLIGDFSSRSLTVSEG
ncbi:hypothetical protein ACROYT_G014236 [Oculina patagonica]